MSSKGGRFAAAALLIRINPSDSFSEWGVGVASWGKVE